ncbi:hypothetical protein [Flavobacterium sedimenticola]|uniref:Lipocalin-like domain-containing protein n=1 Tax=Flavobacterium sedimenticola TaxID=3043286 RepID=A0ABT6XS26_9FLAO|nr:hypothetical protein [Flavobacterium sedimenticola]MDI9257894.1 hypothetical protein [Flavobacterium sedimenticola]
MKKMPFLKLTLFALTLLLFACSSDNDSNSNTGLGPGKWKLGSYTFTRGVSNQSGTPANDGQLFVIVCSTSGAGNLGEYSGSAITCEFFDRGAGEYTIVDNNTFGELVNPTEKYIYIDCSIGTATTTGSALYGCQSTTKKAIITIENNQYKVTVPEEIQMTKILDVNGGIDGAATTYSFGCNKIY